MLTKHFNSGELGFKISVKYDGPLGGNRITTVVEWLKANVGVEDIDWMWLGYTIAMNDREGAIALKLKFGL